MYRPAPVILYHIFKYFFSTTEAILIAHDGYLVFDFAVADGNIEFARQLLDVGVVNHLIQRPVLELIKLLPVFAVFKVHLKLRLVIMRVVAELEQIVFIRYELPASAGNRERDYLGNPV